MKFELKKTKSGFYFYFTLHARNGKVVATSEMYESKQACKKGIRSVRLTAPFASVKDFT